MDSTGAAEINKSIKTLLAELKNEISIGNKSLKKVDVDSIVNKINRLENIYDQLLSKSKSKDTIAELLNIQADLEDNRANLISQIENTKDSIWSVDQKLNIKTINSNFSNDYKIAFGVRLKEGVNVLISLPEPLKSIWKERYQKALSGEQFSIIDRFDIENIPQYIETSFTPVKIGDEIIGVACFGRDITKQKESEEQFKLLAKLSPNPISIISVEGYIYVNTAWEEVFGYSKEEALLMGIDKIIPDATKKETLKAIKKFILHGTENIRHTYKVVTK